MLDVESKSITRHRYIYQNGGAVCFLLPQMYMSYKRGGTPWAPPVRLRGGRNVFVMFHSINQKTPILSHVRGYFTHHLQFFRTSSGRRTETQRIKKLALSDQLIDSPTLQHWCNMLRKPNPMLNYNMHIQMDLLIVC